MSVKYGLLGILARRPQHGYELKRSFEQITGGFWQLNYGQIYQTLDRLEGEGFVRHTVESDDGVPDRKVYAITGEGREALDAWIANPAPRPRPLRDELFIRLAVMSASERGEREDVLALLGAHRALYLEKMRELTGARERARDEAASASDVGTDATEARLGLVEELLVDAALFHVEADLRWLEHCEAKLRARAWGRAS